MARLNVYEYVYTRYVYMKTYDHHMLRSGIISDLRVKMQRVARGNTFFPEALCIKWASIQELVTVLDLYVSRRARGFLEETHTLQTWIGQYWVGGGLYYCLLSTLNGDVSKMTPAFQNATL